MSFTPSNIIVDQLEWVPTPELRFRTPNTTTLPKLQQRWINKSTGATEWRYVPTTIGA